MGDDVRPRSRLGFIAMVVAATLYVLLGSGAPGWSSAAAAKPPKVGAETTVSAASGNQTAGASAFDGTNSLVVWADSRNGGSDIYGARVAADGHVLDPNGFPISTAIGSQVAPKVIYYGPHYLVVWEDHRAGANGDIYASRVTTGGVVIDTGGAAFCTQAANQTQPDIAFDGSGALVVWRDSRANGIYDIYGTRWTIASGVPNQGGFPISTATGDQFAPAVTFYGPNYLVAWQDHRAGGDIYAARVTTAPATVDTDGVAMSTAPNGQGSPALAYNGNIVLIVWTDLRNGGSADVFGARWSPSSGLVDPGGLAITTAPTFDVSPSVQANGQFLVAWISGTSDPYNVYAARVADNGTVTDSTPVPVGVTSGQSPVALAKEKGNKWIAVYDRDTNLFSRTISPK